MSSSASLAGPAPRPVRAAMTLLLVLLALVASVLVAPAASAEPATEGDFIAKLNAERSARGLPGLQVTQDLTDVARAHSDRMAAQNRLYHNPNLTTDVHGWLRVSENVGFGPDVPALHSALMNSTGHRTNMLDTVVTQVGIGTAWKDGKLWVTQVFRKPDSSTVNAPAPAAPAPAAAPPPPPPAPVDLGLAACPKGYPTGRFADVPTGTPAAANIDCAAWWRLVEGVSSGRFEPGVPVNRAQVASLVARQLRLSGRLPDASRDYFGDDSGTPHQANINALAEAGVMGGTSQGTFSPYARLTRAQLASVLVRVQEHVLGHELPEGAPPFSDVSGNTHARAIGKAYAAGLTTGLTPTSYGPAGDVTRQNMAAFLVRGVDKLLAKNLVTRP